MPAQARKKSETRISKERRADLIEATIHSLAEHGIAGTTISTICAAANISRGLIAHYFDSKDDLMGSALRDLYESVSRPVQEETSKPGMTAEQRLRKFPEVLFSNSVFSERNRSAFISLWHETRFNDVVRKTNQELYRGYLLRMEQLFTEAAAEKSISIDAHTAAIGFIGLSDGLWLGMSIHDTIVTRRKSIDTCLRFIDRELAG